MEKSVLIPPIMPMIYSSSAACLLLVLLYLSSIPSALSCQLDFRKITHHTAWWDDHHVVRRLVWRKVPGHQRKIRNCLPTLRSTGMGAGERCLQRQVSVDKPEFYHLQMNEVSENSTNIMQACRGAGRAVDWGGQTTWGRTSRGASSACRKSRPSSSFMLFLVTGTNEIS